MHRYALNTHLIAQLCESRVGWFIQLGTTAAGGGGSQGASRVQGTIVVVPKGSRFGAVMTSFAVALFGAGNDWQWVEGGGRVQLAGSAAISYFVVDVGWALRRHLLDNVDGVSVVPAHLLVVRAVG